MTRFAEGTKQGNETITDVERVERIAELEQHLRNVLGVLAGVGGWLSSVDQATLRAAREALR